MKKSVGNSPVVYPTPVYLVGTYSEGNQANIMTVAWGGICCSKPPCLAVSLRKATHSYGNIVREQAFTVSVPSVEQVRQADYAGIYSGRDEDKFAATGWTPVRGEFVNAPYVEECPLIAECKVLHTIEIGLHTQFIGEILDIKADEQILDEKGRPDIEKGAPFVFAPGSRKYFGIGAFVGQGFEIGKKA